MRKSCPFCGKDKLKVDSKRSNRPKHIDGVKYYTYTLSVRCNCCHARGPSISRDVKAFNGGTVVTEDFEQLVFDAWNNRV